MRGCTSRPGFWQLDHALILGDEALSKKMKQRRDQGSQEKRFQAAQKSRRQSSRRMGVMVVRLVNQYFSQRTSSVRILGRQNRFAW